MRPKTTALLIIVVAFLSLLLLGCRKPPAPPAQVTPPPRYPNPPVLVISPANPERISGNGRHLIYEFEVGGGKLYYDKFLSRPTVPPEASGLTVGIGFDCGYNTASQIRKAWHAIPEEAERLSNAAGLTQARARAILPSLRDIQIAWAIAEEVFNETSLADFLEIADNAYPGMDALHPDAQAVLVSLTFNRGSSMTGARRREMRAIRGLVPKHDYRGMAAELRKMARLWPDTRGLIRRREAEAKLMESCSRCSS